MPRCLWAIALSVFLCFSWLNPAIAAVDQPVPYTTAQLDRGNELRTQAFMATNQGEFATAEEYWTKLLELFPENPAIWSNRGNSRVSQLKLTAAVADFDRSIQLAPELTDAYLNRGAAWEGLKEWDKAIADYQHILAVDTNDAMAYNNLGNAYAGREEWAKAKTYYLKATELEPAFAFARANYALALYQVGERVEAIR